MSPAVVQPPLGPPLEALLVALTAEPEGQTEAVNQQDAAVCDWTSVFNLVANQAGYIFCFNL